MSNSEFNKFKREGEPLRRISPEEEERRVLELAEELESSGLKDGVQALENFLERLAKNN